MGNKRNRSRKKKQKGRVINIKNKRNMILVDSRKRNHENIVYCGEVATPEPSKKRITVLPEATMKDGTPVRSLSGRKLDVNCNNQMKNSDDYNFIMNFEILKNLIKLVGCCPSCKSCDIDIENIFSLRMGFQSTLQVHCSSCSYKYTFSSSKQCSQVGRGSSGRQMSEVNLRTVMAFREIGCGHRAIENFSRIMNIQAISVGAL